MPYNEAGEGFLARPRLTREGSGIMNYLHYEIDSPPDHAVQVTLDRQANVRLLDEENFQKYTSGQKHTYHGGLAEKSPVVLEIPHPGRWHLVIDLGGYAGKVNASVEALRGVHGRA
jgi:hypothetical protein